MFQIELVKLQEWIRRKQLRVVVLFEGRDAAGKGGIIKSITEATNPRIVKVKALAAPSSRERTEWYFQRYVKELPAGGEMALFDRRCVHVPVPQRHAEVYTSKQRHALHGVYNPILCWSSSGFCACVWA